MVYLLVGLALVGLTLLLLEAKTSRHDGTLVSVHPYRRIMWFMMRTGNESVVFWDFNVRAEKLLEYLEVAKGTVGAQPTHALVGAIAIALNGHPAMNRFVSGKRMYQRKGRWVSFVMKRKRMDETSGLAVVKLEIPDEWTFADLCSTINGQIGHQRSGAQTFTDKEIGWFNLLPRPVFSLVFWAANVANHYNVLPPWFIDGDPMHASVIISNVGSMGMDPGYHHLYEWGNCPIVLMVGQVNDVPVPNGDQVEWTKQMTIRVTYDERVNDGLSAFRGVESIKRILEDPFNELGCVAEDGSDRFALLDRSRQESARDGGS